MGTRDLGKEERFWRLCGGAGLGGMGAGGFLRGPGEILGIRVRIVLELPSSSLLGPEKSQLVSGEATVSELDGLEPDTEYTVRVWARVAGVDGTPASAVVRTGKWPWPAADHMSLTGPFSVYSWQLQLPAPSLILP